MAEFESSAELYYDDRNQADFVSRPGSQSEMRPPSFTVLMATYNHSSYLSETLHSISNQTNRDFEVVIVDDGSTDDSWSLLQQWSAGENPDIDVLLVRTPNRGQSAALETGFLQSKGVWICLIDSDDIWLDEKLGRLAQTISNDHTHDCGMVVHPLQIMDEAGRLVGATRPLRARLTDGDARNEMRSTGRHVAPATSGIAIRRDVFNQLMPMATRSFKQAADSYLTFGATLITPILAIKEPLAHYRIHSGGQYLKRMLSVEGLRQTVNIQRTIANHFGMLDTVSRDSYFQRNEFALAKLSKAPFAGVLRAWLNLARATVSDKSFDIPARLLLVAFWSVMGILPARLFQSAWLRFQLFHTGLGRIDALA